MSEHQVCCVACKHYEKINGRIVEARCPMTNISFTKYRVDAAPVDARTFFCAFAERK